MCVHVCVRFRQRRHLHVQLEVVPRAVPRRCRAGRCGRAGVAGGLGAGWHLQREAHGGAVSGGLAVGGEQRLVQRTAARAAAAPRRTALGRRLKVTAQLLDKLRRAAEPVAPERGELAQQSVLVQHAQHLQRKGGRVGASAVGRATAGGAARG